MHKVIMQKNSSSIEAWQLPAIHIVLCVPNFFAEITQNSIIFALFIKKFIFFVSLSFSETFKLRYIPFS